MSTLPGRNYGNLEHFLLGQNLWLQIPRNFPCPMESLFTIKVKFQTWNPKHFCDYTRKHLWKMITYKTVTTIIVIRLQLVASWMVAYPWNLSLFQKRSAVWSTPSIQLFEWATPLNVYYFGKLNMSLEGNKTKTNNSVFF